MSISDDKWDKIKKKWADKNPEFTSVSNKKDFKKDLKRGQDGEHSFFMKYQHCITKLDGFKNDFELNKTGEKIELKTDFYDIEKTGNFFMEKISYEGKLGGPWQALENGSEYYIYYYFSSGDIFIFNTAQLVKRLKKIEFSLPMISVNNKSHITKGYKVKRDLLLDIQLSPEDIGLFEVKGK